MMKPFTNATFAQPAISQRLGRPEPVVPTLTQPAPRRFSFATLTKILGKKPAPATIDDKIAALRGEILAAEARQHEATEKLKRPGLLSDAEHEQAEADVGAARRAIVRANDVIQGLEAEREVLAAAEAKAAFLKHVEAARVRAAEAGARLATEYEPAAKLIANILDDLKASQAEIMELVGQGREFGEAVDIESPFAVSGTVDSNDSYAVAAQRPNLLTHVSLPGLWNAAPIVGMDFEAVNRARAFRMPR